jgi:hypothetical protein
MLTDFRRSGQLGRRETGSSTKGKGQEGSTKHGYSQFVDALLGQLEVGHNNEHTANEYLAQLLLPAYAPALLVPNQLMLLLYLVQRYGYLRYAELGCVDASTSTNELDSATSSTFTHVRQAIDTQGCRQAWEDGVVVATCDRESHLRSAQCLQAPASPLAGYKPSASTDANHAYLAVHYISPHLTMPGGVELVTINSTPHLEAHGGNYGQQLLRLVRGAIETLAPGGSIVLRGQIVINMARINNSTHFM